MISPLTHQDPNRSMGTIYAFSPSVFYQLTYKGLVIYFSVKIVCTTLCRLVLISSQPVDLLRFIEHKVCTILLGPHVPKILTSTHACSWDMSGVVCFHVHLWYHDAYNNPVTSERWFESSLFFWLGRLHQPWIQNLIGGNSGVGVPEASKKATVSRFPTSYLRVRGYPSKTYRRNGSTRARCSPLECQTGISVGVYQHSLYHLLCFSAITAKSPGIPIWMA